MRAVQMILALLGAPAMPAPRSDARPDPEPPTPAAPGARAPLALVRGDAPPAAGSRAYYRALKEAAAEYDAWERTRLLASTRTSCGLLLLRADGTRRSAKSAAARCAARTTVTTLTRRAA